MADANHHSIAINFSREFDNRGNRIELGANFGGTLLGGVISGGVDDFENGYEYDYLNRLTSIVQQSQSGGHAVAPKLAEFDYNRASQLTDLHQTLWKSDFVSIQLDCLSGTASILSAPKKTNVVYRMPALVFKT
ncbi:hypothetical protein [Novipirellula caenicola]|uniref:Uncharacterized protein n=1 Tax=Novipirellula caenicola TaxID=1536901 RepID=A0ABP9W005_9BACT